MCVTIPTRRLRLVLAVGVLLAAGCSGQVTLSGTVTVNGTPLEQGSIMVQGGKGEVVVGTITKGEYTVGPVSGGAVKIALDTPAPPADGQPAPGPTRSAGRGRITPPPEGADPNAQPAPQPPPSVIPNQYRNLETTPLTHNTSDGKRKDITIP